MPADLGHLPQHCSGSPGEVAELGDHSVFTVPCHSLMGSHGRIKSNLDGVTVISQQSMDCLVDVQYYLGPQAACRTQEKLKELILQPSTMSM